MAADMSKTNDEWIAELVARLNAPKLNWVEAYHHGDALRTDEAAYIADCSDQTIRRYAEQAASAGHPLGIFLAKSIWLIDLNLLLQEIDRRHGAEARAEAEKRVARTLGLRASQQILTRSITATTG
jgi:hypothetical protein